MQLVVVLNFNASIYVKVRCGVIFDKYNISEFVGTSQIWLERIFITFFLKSKFRDKYKRGFELVLYRLRTLYYYLL